MKCLNTVKMGNAFYRNHKITSKQFVLLVINLKNFHVVNGGCLSGFYCDVNVNLDIYVNYVTIKEVGIVPLLPSNRSSTLN